MGFVVFILPDRVGGPCSREPFTSAFPATSPLYLGFGLESVRHHENPESASHYSSPQPLFFHTTSPVPRMSLIANWPMRSSRLKVTLASNDIAAAGLILTRGMKGESWAEGSDVWGDQIRIDTGYCDVRGLSPSPIFSVGNWERGRLSWDDSIPERLNYPLNGGSRIIYARLNYYNVSHSSPGGFGRDHLHIFQRKCLGHQGFVGMNVELWRFNLVFEASYLYVYVPLAGAGTGVPILAE